jgi:hypothetical protein
VRLSGSRLSVCTIKKAGSVWNRLPVSDFSCLRLDDIDVED